MHQTFHSTPTWTLKSRHQTITASNQSGSYPGPSTYIFDKVTQKSPSFGIGTAKRAVFNPADGVPGPGSYELKSSIADGPKKSMSSRPQLVVKNSPGPQHYHPDEIKMKKAEPKYTIRLRSKSFQDIVRDRNQYQPAPNHYNLTGSFNNPKGVIGTAIRKELNQHQKTPGPGTYLTIDKLEASKGLNSTTNPRCSIGTSPRKANFLQASANFPGPGAYTASDFADLNKSKKKGFSMRPQTTNLEEVNKCKIPGPGQYEVNLSNKFKSPSYGYGSTKRLSFMDNAERLKTPGPGTHQAKPDLRYRTTTSWKFSVSPRKSLYEFERTPGPGTYQERKNQVLIAAPKFSVSKSLAAIDEYMGSKKATPAPNQYEPRYRLVKESLHQTFTATEKRPDFEKARFTPGPGAYTIQQNRGAPQWKFGSQKKLSFTESRQASRSPGPPDYKIKAMVPNPPSYMRVTQKVQFNPPVANP